MTNASSSKNRALFLAVLMAVSVPSASLAEGETHTPDAVLTVSVNMGSNDAGDGGDSSGCNGFSSLRLSAAQLESRVERVFPAVANPTIQQRLAALKTPSIQERTLSLNDTVEVLVNGEAVNVRVLTKSDTVSGSWIVHPQWINRWSAQNDTSRREGALAIVSELIQQDLSSYGVNDPFWTDEIISFSATTPSLAMVDRRTYITSPFTVSFDASTCESDVDSEARISIERTPLEASSLVNGTSRWLSVETDWDSGLHTLAPFLTSASEGGFRGDAHLVQQSPVGFEGDGRFSWKVAALPFGGDGGLDPWDYYWQDTISGESGDIAMRGVTNLSGELSQNAQFRTTYLFWMEVDPTGEWDNRNG